MHKLIHIILGFFKCRSTVRKASNACIPGTLVQKSKIKSLSFTLPSRPIPTRVYRILLIPERSCGAELVSPPMRYDVVFCWLHASHRTWPNSLVKDCIDIVITMLSSAVNLSILEGSFTYHFKSALVSPLLTRPTLNKDSMTNHWPVSNLNFLSKELEKVVVNQLNSHINSSNTSNQYQSACRKFHSTETALLKIHNDIIASMDAGKVTALTLVNLSAAFDTIYHTFLSRSLDDWFGVTGKAPNWFQSYLTARDQMIKLADCLPSKSDLTFGGPQGSVLGPLPFTFYNTPLSSMISGQAIPHQLYANDIQLYVSFASGHTTAALNDL